MFNRIIHFSIHNKLIIGILTCALIGWGLFSLSHLSIDAVPDITDNQVQIITSSPDLSAQEVERFITFPLEMEMGNIPDVEEIRSISRFGLSVITIVFKEHVDIYWAREQINQKIQIAKTEIPDGMGDPEMGPISTGLGEVYQYVIYPEKGYEEQFNAIELRTIQDWVIKRQLIGVEGVVEVNSSGGYLKQYEISIDQNRMKAFDISMDDVFQAVEKNNANAGGSYIEKTNQTFFIRGEGMVESISDLEQIVVRSNNNLPVLLKNVASVTIEHAPRFGAVTMNGNGEVVAGQVMMLKGENSMEVTNRIKERIISIKNSLPEGLVLEPYLDRSKLVNNTTRTVITNLVEGALIVIFILVLLLGNFRAGLIVASVIPLSMLFAVSLMHIFGVSANLMSLGALDFGLIVDGAVIMVEAILHHLGVRNQNTNLSNIQKEGEVFTAASKIRKSAAFGEIIILIVYLPILFLQGVEGKMFIPMAQTVSFAILGAFILSMTYVPMMSALFLKNSRVNEKGLANRIISAIYKLYAPARDFAFKIKYLVIVLSIITFGLSLWLFSRMGGEFIPTLEEGDFALHQILPPGSSIAKGVEVSAKLQDIILNNFPEVEKVVTKIGTAEIPTDIMPLEAGDIFVILKPKKEWTSARTREEMFEKMEEEMNRFPGVMYEFTQPIQMRFNELMTGVRQDIAIKIYGEDLGVLANKANEAESILQHISGVGDIQVEATGGLQQMVVKYNRERIAKYGVSIAHLNDILKMAFAGKAAGYFYEKERKYDIVIRLQKSERQDIQSLETLNVDLPNGGYVPMSELAKISFEEGPAQISRDDTKRRITIGVNARNTDIATLIDNIKVAFENELNLPSGYYVRYGGQFENLERARSRLLVVVPIALALIFLLLFFTFQSAKQALLIFTAIPLSAIGGIWALYLRGMPMSISAGVGFIALFGVAVLNGIVLVAYFNQLKKEGMTDIMEIIKKGTYVRLRPVIMTASVASLGFLPMALSNTAGAEVQRPLATVVIGGLITATLLTLILLPILYYLLEKGKRVKIKSIGSCLLFVLGAQFLSAQSPMTLENVLLLVEQQDGAYAQSILHQKAALDLKIQKPVAPPPLNIALNGDEFNIGGISGVQSLGVQKNFQPKKIQEGYKNLYRTQKDRLDNMQASNKLSMKQEVARIYIEAAYLESMRILEERRKLTYHEYVSISEKLQQVGHSGGIAKRQATLQAEDIELSLEGIAAQKKLYLELLESWVGEHIDVYSLEEISYQGFSTDINAHPDIQNFELEKQLLLKQNEILISQSAPVWNTGAKLQMVNGQVLFFGYQVGVQVPLSKSYLKQQSNATQSNMLAMEEQEIWQRQHMEREQKNFKEMAAVQKLRLDKIEEHLVEHELLTADIKKAYRFGEVDYTDVITSYNSFFDLQKEKIEITKIMLTNINQFTNYINH